MSESHRRHTTYIMEGQPKSRSEEKKLRRASSAASNGPSKSRRSSSANRASARSSYRKISSVDIPQSAPSTDRIGMLVIEANEISSCLQKPYVFRKEDESCENEADMRIRVTNTTYHICTTWSCSKLKERLGRMRRLMYASESETSGFGGESVFFDPDDAWVKVPSENQNGGLTNGAVTNGHVTSEHQHGDVVRRRKHGDRSDRPKPVRPISMPVELPVNGVSRAALLSSGELPAQSEFIRYTSPTGEVDQNSGPLSARDHSHRMSPLTSVLPDRPISVNNNGKEDEIPNYHHRPTGTVTPIRDVSSTVLDKHSSLKKSSSSISSRSGSYRKKTVTHSVSCQTDEGPVNHRPLSVLTLCKEMVVVTAARTKGSGRADHIVDRILCSCECAKEAVVNILEAYTQAVENSTHADDSFRSSNLVGVSSFQLVTTVELLVSHSSLWVGSSKSEESSLSHQVGVSITSTVQQLADELVVFLQGCETDQENTVQDSATRIFDHLFDLVKLCGELSMASDILPHTLKDTEKETLEDLISMKEKKDNDVARLPPSTDLKQAFSAGGDSFLDHTLQEGLATLEECEESVQSLSELATTENQVHKEILKHVYIAMATSKLLVLKCHQSQEDICNNMKSDENKPDDYFFHYFQRSLFVITEVNHLVDNITLLNEASVPFGSDHEEEHGNLRKLYRCVEMVERATNKLQMAFKMDPKSSHDKIDSASQDTTTNRLRLNLQSDNLCYIPAHQIKEVESASKDSEQATVALVEIIRGQLPKAAHDIGGKVKRMLPATPGRALVRCNSARTPDTPLVTHIRSSLHGIGQSLDV